MSYQYSVVLHLLLNKHRWNASTIGEYWRLWNLPVYQWFKRHIYLQVIIKHRKPAWVAGVLAFFISAIGHEILVGIPTHSFEGWAFLAMMGQIPLIAITELVNQIEQYGFRHVWRGGKKSSRRSKTQQQETKQPVVSDQQQQLDLQKEPAKQRKHGSFGNYFFWISFCILGQPLSILLYYRSYLMRSHPELIQNT
jgi:diacylglycerol O-acyltransferase-1